MLRRNVLAFLAVVATVCSGSGFAETKVYRFYEGEPRDPSTIAILNTGRCGVLHEKHGDEWWVVDGGVERISVDGKAKVTINGKEKKVYLSDAWTLELVPGEHTIEILDNAFPRPKLQFAAKAGHRYRVLRWQSLDGISTKFWIKDETTGETLGKGEE